MIPEFIDKAFVEKVWRRYLQDEDVTVEECNLELVGAKGDNYSSVMCRAQSKIRKNGQLLEKRMVIKTMPTAEGAIKYVTDCEAFKKEILMMGRVMPEIEKILKTIDVEVTLAARLYLAELQPNPVIAMQDLAVDGFAVRNRFEGLTFEECLTVAKSLAEFHATSILLLKNNPDLAADFKISIWNPQDDADIRPGLSGAINYIIELIEGTADGKWTEKLRKFAANQPDQFFALTRVKNPKRPLVINHGDAWVNNMMFKSSTDFRFVDLQLSWINSPIFDLQYFIFTSMSPKIRFTHMESFLKAYHKRFVEISELLGIDVAYSYDDLKQDFRDKAIFGFTMSYFVQAVILAPPEDAVDTSKFDDDLWRANPIFRNKRFLDSFTAGLPFFETMGIFEM